MQLNKKENAMVSVIIPIYKTEKYLEECLNSVLSQKICREIKNRKIEIICVDDESPDNSKEIVQKFMEKNNNITLLSQKNQGQSVARNNAIKIAKGKYIVFLDSDDLLPEGAISSLVTLAEETGSEVVVSHAKAFNSRRSWYIEPHAEVASASFRKVKFFHRAIFVNTPPPWAKLYNRNLLIRNNIIFPVGIKLAEDWIFVINAMYKANHISSTPEVTYLYRGRDDEENPSCTQIVNEKIFSDLLSVYDLSKKFNLPLQQQKYAKLFILKGVLYRLGKFSLDNEINSCKKIYQSLRQFLVEDVGLDMIYTFTPERRLPLLLIYYSFYSEAHRVMNGILKPSCLRRSIEARDEEIEKDYLAIKEKVKNKKKKKSISKVTRKKIKIAKWKIKYHIARGLSNIFYRKKNISLIGERLGNTANDSSFYLFSYLNSSRYDSNSGNDYYYVIKRGAKTAVNLSGYKNIVYYGSLKHFIIFNAAKNYIFSDSMRDVFHRWKDIHHNHDDKKKFFLQHGIFALNRASGYYDANSMLRRHELPDKFIVSSEHEKNLICKNFGFEKNRVAVTGLSRFDTLPKKQTKPSKTILLLFTWRDNLNNISMEKFTDSQYYKNLCSLLKNKRLSDIINTHGYSIEACLHHKLHKYLQATQNITEFKIHSMNEVNVQSLIINSDIMVTDYSSASFDTLYQNKPVLYYWFDSDKFFATRGGPLINPLIDMPGEICRTEESLINEIEELIDKKVKQCFVKNKKADVFFKYKDNNNCKRIVDLIESN